MGVEGFVLVRGARYIFVGVWKVERGYPWTWGYSLLSDHNLYRF
jgi:hypothetical protein